MNTRSDGIFTSPGFFLLNTPEIRYNINVMIQLTI